jgi:hypothetical protein
VLRVGFTDTMSNFGLGATPGAVCAKHAPTTGPIQRVWQNRLTEGDAVAHNDYDVGWRKKDRIVD